MKAPFTVEDIMRMRIALKSRTTQRNINSFSSVHAMWRGVTEKESVLAEPTRRAREIINSEAEKKVKDKAKVDNFPVVYLSALWKERDGFTRAENLNGNTGVLVLDFDTDQDPIDTMVTLWDEMPQMMFCALSASGNGVWAAVAIDSKHWDSSVIAAFQYSDSIGLPADRSCVDITRARFVAHSYDAYLCRELDYVPDMFHGGVGELPEGKTEEPPTVADCLLEDFGALPIEPTKAMVTQWVNEHFSRLSMAEVGTRDTTATSVIGHLKRLVEEYDYLDADALIERYVETCEEIGLERRKTRQRVRRLWL